MYFFTADFHFGEDEIIEREARPFSDMEAMTDGIIDNINSQATEDDTLFVIGDWINYNKLHHSDISVFDIVRKFRPKVILIMGNNEDRLKDEVFGGDFESMRKVLIEKGFTDVRESMDIEFGGEKFHLVHCPEDHVEGLNNLMGHTHRATGLWKPYGLNVGTDLNHFRPFSENEIFRLLKMKREWWDSDPSVLSL